MTNLSPLSLSDERIIAIKKAARCMDPAKPWGDTLAFARDLIAALSQEADSTTPASGLHGFASAKDLAMSAEWQARNTAPVASRHTIKELLALYDKHNGDWCLVARAVEERFLSAPPQTPSPVAPEPESKVPALMDGMFLVPCAVMKNPEHPQQGWLFIPHADAKWVSLCKLPEFSAQVINYWLNEPNDGG